MSLNNTKLASFLDDEVSNYAVYRTVQRIPNFIDTLSQTQRKIIYVMQKTPNKKVKTAEAYTIIYNETDYRHGDISAINTAENLAASYNNNISLLVPEGTFGYRTVKKASSPRYTSIIYGKIAQAIFNKRDNVLFKDQYTSKKIEPHYLLPIIPIALINGIEAIAMGFKCSINPRDPKFIIDTLIKILSGKLKKVPDNLPVYYPYFNGLIEKSEDSEQYKIKGIFEKKPRNTIEITELPISKNREKYIEFLKELLKDKKIRSFTEECKKNTFLFKIKVETDVYNLSDEKLYNFFNLEETVSDSITFLDYIDDKYTIKQYNTASEFFKDWIVRRFSFFQQRKDFELNQLKTDISFLHEKRRFIELILDDKIFINRKTKTEIINQLEFNNFLKYNDSFDYLIGMPLYSLSSDEVDKINNTIHLKENEAEELEKIPVNDIWLSELKELKKVLVDELKEKTT